MVAKPRRLVDARVLPHKHEFFLLYGFGFLTMETLATFYASHVVIPKKKKKCTI